MKKNSMGLNHKKILLASCFLLLIINVSSGQFLLKNRFDSKINIYLSSEFIDVGLSNLKISQVMSLKTTRYKLMPSENTDLGFTNHNFWIRFKLKNNSNEKLFYYFETARPITDIAELYTIKSNNIITKQISGDGIPFSNKSVNHRKTIFKINLEPNEVQQFYLHLKSDGELLSVPMVLHSSDNLLITTSFEQFVFGLFYGILIIASVLYMFFFFAMRDRTFLYYSLYVVFIGLLQFSVDGYFYEFFTPQSGWLSLHSVILCACIANFFLGRYAQVFLKIIKYNHTINVLFYVLYGLDFTLILLLLLFPKTLEFSYPIANILGLILLGLIISSQIVIYSKTKRIDRFFATGIFFLISGFVVFILKNFSLLPLNFWTENGSKFGTGLEIIFLSLSMANLIRNLKNEREILQSLALQKSEEMNELKSYFLSNISHELRTPLNAILNTAKSIASETKDEVIKKNSEIIKYSSYSLLNSINDILDFSKIEKNQIELEITEFDIVKVVEHISNNFAREAHDKGLIFSFIKGENLPQSVKGDAVRLSQILQNILSNALKFTNKGFINFKIEAIRESNKQVQIIFTISDSGVGISKEKIDSIFDSFSQEDINNKRKFGGLGLGLYIVKHLINLQKGNIKVDSLQGAGTVFTITLSYEYVIIDKEINDLFTTEEYDLKGISILVVEDNAMNQLVIKMITKKWKNTLINFANNGEEGIQKLKENHFDIILMDLQMPIMDGYEATILIRKGAAGENKKTIPIIALTADVMESTKSRVIEIGMNKYLSKPIDKEILYKTINSFVANKSQNL